MKAKELLEDRLNKVLTELGVKNVSSKTFIIVPTGDEIKYSSFDDILRFWQTPLFKGIKLDYDETLDSLVSKENNLVPSWIKITSREKLPIRLEISQRFRKCKEVVERNLSNPFAPFEIDNTLDIDELILNERREAIRILLFSRTTSNKLNNIIGEKIRFNEIELFFKNHFKIYRFYPPLPNHQKQNDENFSKIIIDRNHITGKFNICNSLKLNDIINGDLSEKEAVEYYMENEMNWQIFKIEITH